MKFPTVTVIVSTYNRGQTFLPLALESIRAQTYKDFEVIVVDDASTDCTPDVLEQFYKKFLERNIEFRAAGMEVNSGYQCVPKNMGIYMAAGDYIAYLDDDNEWMPEHLEKLMAPMDNDIDLDLTYCWRKYVGDPGSPELQSLNNHPPEWDRAKLSILNHINCIDTSDMLHSRGIAYRIYDSYGTIWDENDRRYGDLTLLKRMASIPAMRGQLVPEELTTYRWHGNNLMITRPVAHVAAVPIGKVLDEIGSIHDNS
jgi:glycosyltransferase involved in cell wall biosynthesis